MRSAWRAAGVARQLTADRRRAAPQPLCDQRAIRNAKALCEAHLDGRYELTIVDVHQNPELARGSRVLATPTLLKGNPAPERMLVGDLSDSERVLLALDVRVVDEVAARAIE